MGNLNLDFTGVGREAPEFPTLEDGNYELVIETAQEKPAKNPPADDPTKVTYPQLAVRFTPVCGLEGSEIPADFKGKVFDNISYHPNFVWKARVLIEAGFNDTYEGSISFDEKDLIGLHVGATITKKRNDAGKWQNQVETYFPLR